MEKVDFWETPTTTEDFFAEVAPDSGIESDVSFIKEELNKNEFETEKPDEGEESDIEDLFGGEIANEEGRETQHPTSGSIGLLNTLKEREILSYELEEGEELTEELAEELIENGINERVQSEIKSVLSELPDDAKKLIQYTLNGGTLDKYISEVYSSDSRISLSKGMSLEEEEEQEAVIRQLMLEEGDTEEVIDTQIELLKETGKLKSFAKGKYQKWEKEHLKAEEDAIKAAKQRRDEELQTIRENKERLGEYLRDKKDIDGLGLSRKDKEEIPSYIEDRNVKLNNGVHITQLQYDLLYDVSKNKEALLQLSILMKNRKEDGSFDFSSIEFFNSKFS